MALNFTSIFVCNCPANFVPGKAAEEEEATEADSSGAERPREPSWYDVAAIHRAAVADGAAPRYPTIMTRMKSGLHYTMKAWKPKRPDLPKFSFIQEEYEVLETHGVLKIKVRRQEGSVLSPGKLTWVTKATGSASPGLDYVFASGNAPQCRDC